VHRVRDARAAFGRVNHRGELAAPRRDRSEFQEDLAMVTDQKTGFSFPRGMLFALFFGLCFWIGLAFGFFK
jgi:hypothetical protein